MAELTPLYMDISGVYSGDELGLPYRDIMGEGVVGAGDLKVTQRASGADLSVDVAAGAAWVLGDTNTDAQPIYRVRNDAVVNLGISPDPSNPRIVSIIAQITDETFAGSGREWELQALHGTPDAVPAAPTLPDSALLLASVAVAAGATTIVDANITDGRVSAQVGGGSATVWKDWTPTLHGSTSDPTLGSGAVQAGRYIEVGGMVIAWGSIAVGTVGYVNGSGDVEIVLPLPAASAAAGSNPVLGAGWVLDASATQIYTAVVNLNTSDLTEALLRTDQTGGTRIGYASPFIFTNNDQLAFQLMYEKA